MCTTEQSVRVRSGMLAGVMLIPRESRFLLVVVGLTLVLGAVTTIVLVGESSGPTTSPTAALEVGTLVLFGSGLMGLAGWFRRRRDSAITVGAVPR